MRLARNSLEGLQMRGADGYIFIVAQRCPTCGGTGAIANPKDRIGPQLPCPTCKNGPRIDGDTYLRKTISLDWLAFAVAELLPQVKVRRRGEEHD